MWSKSKVEFQHAGRQFFENGSSYIISAVSWDMSSEVGLQIVFDRFTTTTSPNPKPMLTRDIDIATLSVCHVHLLYRNDTCEITTGFPYWGIEYRWGVSKFCDFLSNRPLRCNQRCCKCVLVKNYLTLKFTLRAAAAATGVTSTFTVKSFPLKIYCCYFVCAAYARSFCDR